MTPGHHGTAVTVTLTIGLFHAHSEPSDVPSNTNWAHLWAPGLRGTEHSRPRTRDHRLPRGDEREKKERANTPQPLSKAAEERLVPQGLSEEVTYSDPKDSQCTRARKSSRQRRQREKERAGESWRLPERARPAWPGQREGQGWRGRRLGARGQQKRAAGKGWCRPVKGKTTHPQLEP